VVTNASRLKTSCAQTSSGNCAPAKKLFRGIVGYDETVIPQLVNAILARHNVILLGLRGQAKSRIIRQLTELLDDQIPIIAGSEVNDDPFHPDLGLLAADSGSSWRLHSHRLGRS
jgi:Mg-chelatase subunit ChlI